MAVYDAYGAQQFYFPNILKYDPDQLLAELSGPCGSEMIGLPGGVTVADVMPLKVDLNIHVPSDYSSL